MKTSNTVPTQGLRLYRGFPPTRWTLVEHATRQDQAGELALDKLLTHYLPVLKTFLTHVKRYSTQDADDLVQGFIVEKVLRGKLLERANSARGKFRTLLLTSLERYLISQHRKEDRVRAGGHTSLETMADLPADNHILPEMLVDYAWAADVVDEGLQRTRTELEHTGRTHFWLLFEARLVKPILHGERVCPYKTIVECLGFASPLQASNALLTAKRTFRRQIRCVLRNYVVSERDVEDKLGELRTVLGSLHDLAEKPYE